MKASRRRLVQGAVLIAVVGVGVAAVILTPGRSTGEAVPAAIPVRITEPRRMDLDEAVGAWGVVASADQVTLLPKVSGTITALSVDEGDSVTRGDVLAEIDPEVYRLEWRQAEAARTAARSTWERLDALYASGNATRQAWEEARAADETAEARADASRLRYDWTKVVSPITGVVLVRHAAVGSLASPTAPTPLYTLGSLDDLEVTVRLPEASYPDFLSEPPSEIRAVSDAEPHRPLDVAIKSVSPRVDPRTRTFGVTCHVQAPDDGYLRPGMLVDLSFVLDDAPEVPTLPAEALVAGGHLWSLDDEDRPVMRELPNPRIVGDFLEIPEDWMGQRFVIEGQYFLDERSSVRILGGGEE